MKRVYVESPFKGHAPGETEKNRKYLAQCLRECCLRGEAPFASHGFYTNFLDDTVPEERAIGIACGLAWGDAGAEETVVYIDRGVSEGMDLGIARAKAARRRIVWRRLGVETPVMVWEPEKGSADEILEG